MKTFALIAALSFASLANAGQTTTFTCSLKKIPGQTFTFKLKNITTNNISSVPLNAEDEYEGVFKTRSRNQDIVAMVDTLNGQGFMDPEMKTDRISFFGDSAGVNFVYFDLFKSSRYRKGFVRLEFNFGEDKQYSEVTCALR